MSLSTDGISFLRRIQAVGWETTFYICEGRTCRAPINKEKFYADQQWGRITWPVRAFSLSILGIMNDLLLYSIAMLCFVHLLYYYCIIFIAMLCFTLYSYYIITVLYYCFSLLCFSLLCFAMPCVLIVYYIYLVWLTIQSYTINHIRKVN